MSRRRRSSGAVRALWAAAAVLMLVACGVLIWSRTAPAEPAPLPPETGSAQPEPSETPAVPTVQGTVADAAMSMLVVETADGLAVFNSCSHAGADCIIREVRAAWPETPIAALIGGLHLFRSSDEVVRAFAGRVRETGIKTIYTGHCTGDRALAILKEELGDGCVRPFETGMVIAVGEPRA